MNPLVIEELITNILSFINDGATYKVSLLVCRLWLSVSQDRIDEFSNHLWTLIKKLPNKNWQWDEILENSNTKIEMIFEKDMISIKEEFIELCANRYNQKCHYKNINELIYGSLQNNPNLTLELIKANPKIPYDFLFYYFNPWNIIYFSKINKEQKEITKQYLQNSESLKKLILQYPNADWNWYAISSHKDITWDIIKQNPTIPWNSYGMLGNPNITWDQIKQNPEKNWNIISKHKNITLDIIINNPTYKWNWYEIAKNPNISWSIICETFPKYNWKWKSISYNPNITWRIVMNNLDCDWNFSSLSSNEFNKTNHCHHHLNNIELIEEVFTLLEIRSAPKKLIPDLIKSQNKTKQNKNKQNEIQGDIQEDMNKTMNEMLDEALQD